MPWYTLLVLSVACQRLGELVLTRRNAALTRTRKVLEQGHGTQPGHNRPPRPLARMLLDRARPGMVNVWASPSDDADATPVVHGHPRPPLDTRLFVVPEMPPLLTGPYQFLCHPNYAATAKIATPRLAHTAWLTAVAFTAANAGLLTVRVRCENAARASVTE